MHPAPRPATLGVLGAGRVGRAITAAAVSTGLADTVLVCSRRRVESTALATDLTDLAATQHLPIQVSTTEHPGGLRAASVLVICVRARFANPTQDRRAGLVANAPLITTLARQLHGFTGPVVMVTNPVDLMARAFAEHCDAPVVGVGSNLDSARYRALVAAHAGVPVGAVCGSVLGEHGHSAVICAHATRVHDQPVALPALRIADQLRHRAASITAGIDRTQHGPAGAVLSTLRKLLGLADGHEELSAPGPGGVYLGQRLRFAAGRCWSDPPELSPAEQSALHASAAHLGHLYDQLRAHLPTP